MKILITGGAGFIGSHLCEKYVKDKHTVICLDNFEAGSINNIKQLLDYHNFKLVRGDVRDKDLLEDVINGVDAIFHMAAQVHVDRSYVEPELTYQVNVLGTLNILNIARFYDVKQIVHASSSEVYGSAQYSPMNENHPLDAPHPYGASKTAGDRLCFSYNKTFGMNIKIVRTFNIFGPRQKDYGYGGVISLFIKRVLRGQPPIIYGDGKQTRDFTYIEDIVEAYDLILNSAIRTPVNIGSGQEVNIASLAGLIIDICGSDVKPVFINPRLGEVMRHIADISKANQELKWYPRTPFTAGLKKYIEWYRCFGNEDKIVI
jgi:UDP-glucose 4-epimerase